MRASICTPGTALVMGVRLPAAGAMVARSVCGVKANGGRPGNELFAGVVGPVGDAVPLFVVRSGLSEQTASAMLSPRARSARSQRDAGPACAARGAKSNSSAQDLGDSSIV